MALFLVLAPQNGLELLFQKEFFGDENKHPNSRIPNIWANGGVRSGEFSLLSCVLILSHDSPPQYDCCLKTFAVFI